MNYTIYIQSSSNWPIADWAASAFMGFKEKGAKVILFEDIEEVPVSRYHMVVAHIEDTLKYFQSLDVNTNRLKLALNIPGDLVKFTKRKLYTSTMKDFKEKWDIFPIFVKPVKVKEFPSGIISRKEYAKAIFPDQADDSQILLSEVVNFTSEWRGYVIDRRLVGLKHYSGDFRIFPDVTVIESAVHSYDHQPAGYAIDFGVTNDGQTLLIECNDGWALGNYGLTDMLYSTLLAKRWVDITKYATK